MVVPGAGGVGTDAHPALETVGVVPDVAASVEVEDVARPDVEVLHGREERRGAARQRHDGADLGLDHARHDDALADLDAGALDLDSGHQRRATPRVGQRERRAARELRRERDRVDAEHPALDLPGALARLARPAGGRGQAVGVVRGQLDPALQAAQLRDAGIPRVGIGSAAPVDPLDDQACPARSTRRCSLSHAGVEELDGVPYLVGAGARVSGQGESAPPQLTEDRLEPGDPDPALRDLGQLQQHRPGGRRRVEHQVDDGASGVRAAPTDRARAPVRQCPGHRRRRRRRSVPRTAAQLVAPITTGRVTCVEAPVPSKTCRPTTKLPAVGNVLVATGPEKSS